MYDDKKYVKIVDPVSRPVEGAVVCDKHGPTVTVIHDKNAPCPLCEAQNEASNDVSDCEECQVYLEDVLDRRKAITGDTSDGYHTFNELYEHRHALFLALCSTLREYAWKSHYQSNGVRQAGWFIAGIDLPDGESISYHIPDKMWPYFLVKERHKAPKWDGHTSQDVISRLLDWSRTKYIQSTFN